MPKDLSRVQNIAITMLENRSFDHILGYLGLPDSGHPLAARIEGVQHAQTYYAHDAYQPRPISSPSLTPDPPHERENIDQQINSIIGPMHGFARSYADSSTEANPARVMEYVTNRYLPVTDFLARNFAVCDNWFACLPASTLPNRLMAASGYALVDHTPDTLFQDARNLFNDDPDDLVYDWLSARDVGWRVYYSGSFFFMQMPRLLRLYQGDVQVQQLFRPIDRLIDDFRNGDLPQVTFIEPLYEDDYRRGSAQASDDHPPASLYGGQRHLKIFYDALCATTGNEWNNLVAFVTYDEHGSFFDHVRPPTIVTPPPPHAQYTDGFKTLGVRVPAIVVSPFVQPASLCEQLLDHTSILKFLGEKFNNGHYTDLVDNRPVRSASVVLDDTLLSTDNADPPPSLDS
jgi:phospholipase C